MQITKTLPILILCLLTGCSKGLDRVLDTDHGSEGFVKSGDIVEKETTKEEQAALIWALSDVIGFDNIKAKFPNKTGRFIIRSEVAKVKETYPKEIEALKVEKANTEAALSELKKITVSDISYSVEKDYFERKTHIRATIHNDSQFQIATLQWRLKLYIDGKSEPVAIADEYDFYEKGLLPNTSAKRDIEIRGFGNERNWDTLEIQNAKTFRVEFELLPESAENFSNKKIVDLDVLKRYENLTNTLETAKSYENI